MVFRRFPIASAVIVSTLLSACDSSETYRAKLSRAVVEIQTFAALVDTAVNSGIRDPTYAEHKEESRARLSAVDPPPIAYREAFDLAVELRGIAVRFDESMKAALPMSDLEARQLLRRREEITRRLATLLSPTPEPI